MSGLKDIGAIIDDLDAMGRLVRIKSEVDINLDLAGIAAEFERGPRAVLFENVKGQDAPGPYRSVLVTRTARRPDVAPPSENFLPWSRNTSRNGRSILSPRSCWMMVLCAR